MKAALRRAGGGGVLGARANSDSDAEDGFLDAAQLRVADALKKRLDKEIELQSLGTIKGAHTSSEASSSASESARGDESESDGGGVALFKNAPRIKKVINGAEYSASFKKPVSRGVESSSDEEERLAMCIAAAVDGQDVAHAAEKAAEKARSNIAPINPGSEDEGGNAKKRKRRREKAEKEAAAAAQLPAAEENGGKQKQKPASSDDGPDKEKKRKKKHKKEKEKKKK